MHTSRGDSKTGNGNNLASAAAGDFYSPLQDNFLRLLVVPPAEEHGLAQLAVVGPFRKGYLANELWFYPLNLFRNPGRIFKWRFIGKEGLHALERISQPFLAESAP